jgi:hypothetical protein
MNFLDSDSANDFGLWASFLGIALFSGWKLHYLFDPDGGARAITAYYALIFFAASLRTVWLSLPFTSSEPLPPVRAQHGRWMEALMGEAVNVLGDIAMMGLFILLVCFWSHMHRKVEERESVEGAPILGRASLSAAGELISPAPHRSYRRGPMENFVIITAAVFLASMINFILYGVGLYNSAVLILFDAIVFCTQAIVLTIEVLVFSSRFLTILRTIAAVNEDARDLQSKRIVAVTIVSCAFLITRFSIEAWFVADNYEFWEGMGCFILTKCNYDYILTSSLFPPNFLVRSLR